MAEGIKHLGFPNFFRVELGVAKIIAAFVLIVPMVPSRIKEWAYTGTAIVFLSAFIAHVAVDGVATTLSSLILLGIWAISFIFFNRVHKAKEGMKDEYVARR